MQFPSSDSDAVELQKRLLKEAASFIINDQIPEFVSVFCVFIHCRFSKKKKYNSAKTH